MYSQNLILENDLGFSQELIFQRLLVISHWSMILGLVFMVASVMVGYVFEEYFSLPTQVVAHISTLLFATLIKLGYVARLVAIHELKEPLIKSKITQASPLFSG